MQNGNTSLLNNFTTQNLMFIMQSNESITINGDIIPRNDAIPLIALDMSVTNNGSSAIRIEVDVDNQPRTDVIDVDFNASNLAGGNPTIFNAVIDKGASTGGFVHALSVTASGSGLVEVEALGVFSGITPLHQHSGVPANMDRALIYDGSFSDVTAAFTSTGNDTTIFVSNSDSVYIGHASIYSEMQFNLDTLAIGNGVQPTFEFTTGAGAWTIFNPIDGTDGMRSDGSIAYEPDDLTGWAVDTIEGSNLYWVRINRTQAGVPVIPIEDMVQIVVGTDFIWDQDGNVEIFSMNVTDDLIVDGNAVFNGQTNFAGTVDGENNAFNNIGAACNDLGATNSFCASNFSGIVDGQGNAFNNLGAAGNDFGAANNLVSSTFSGLIDMGSNFIYFNTGRGIIANYAGNPSITFSGDGTTFSHLNINIITGTDNDESLIKIGRNVNTTGFRQLQIFPHDGSATEIFNLDMATGDINIVGNINIVNNNTKRLYSDAVRVADAFFVVSHVKSQVTDLQLEAEYKPNKGELFIEGDIVCLLTWKTFTNCDATHLKVLGPVHLLRVLDVVGYENVVKYSEFDKLDYTEKKEVWGVVDYEVVIVVEGPYLLKVCSPIFEGQLLIAGIGGCAIGVNSYSDIPSFMFVFGYAAFDSKGGFVEAVIL